MVGSVFFGFGLVLLTLVQKRPDASQAGLDRFLFGQAATLLERDVVLVSLTLTLAPERGVVWNAIRARRNRGRLRAEAVLHDLYAPAMRHAGSEHAHPVSTLEAMRMGRGSVRRSLEAVLVEPPDPSQDRADLMVSLDRRRQLRLERGKRCQAG